MLTRILVSTCFLVFISPLLVRGAGRPNILFCMADDWGWPDASAYGNSDLATPTFDRLAREGVLFENAFVAATSCTPSRNCILTGQWMWRLEEGANQRSTLHPKFPVFTLLLQQAGYHIGHWRKAWGPGDWAALGRSENPAGPEYQGFGDFLRSRPDKAPFCFWLGTSDPHRPYAWQSGERSGIFIEDIQVPADLPDHPIVRHDIADYYLEVQRFDADVADAISLLQATDELDNTLIVVTSDHGMPFPRHKAQLYDSGTHVPLVVRWGAVVPAGRKVTDFVSLTDLATTFLQAAEVAIPAQMTGQSLWDILLSSRAGRIESGRAYTMCGRERHAQDQEQPESGGYPMRALRTDEFLYVRNFEPQRWPAGSPAADQAFCGVAYASCDVGPSKEFLMTHRKDPQVQRFYQLAFGKRPIEELYDLRNDPQQLINVAQQSEYADVRQELATQLLNKLKDSGDPRLVGGAEFDRYRFRR